MIRIYIGVLGIAFVLGGILMYHAWGANPAPPQTADVGVIEKYVRENISTLSPEPAVLGGTFYVTDIQIDSETHTGTVWYEDGHIALVADFQYEQGPDMEPTITWFTLKNPVRSE